VYSILTQQLWLDIYGFCNDATILVG